MILLTNAEIVDLFYKKTIESNPTDFIEVGCFEASASKYLSSHLPECTVTAYEANPVNFEHFNKELKDYNIKYVNKAVSNFNGDTTFYLINTSKVSVKSSLSKRTKSRKEKPVTVECNTLDYLHDKKDGIYTMWIDAEGHGYEVLEGASNLLSKTKYILIEVEKEAWWVDQKLDIDVIQYLESNDFVPIAYDREWSQYNILFEKHSS